MDKNFELIIYRIDGAVDSYFFYNTEQEALDHANLFTDKTDGELYKVLEIKYIYHRNGHYEDELLHQLRPWQN